MDDRPTAAKHMLFDLAQLVKNRLVPFTDSVTSSLGRPALLIQEIDHEQSKDNRCWKKQTGNVQRLKERKVAMRNKEQGKIGWILLWLLGIPIPILLVLFVLRGCT
jgi:hypothetical protein